MVFYATLAGGPMSGGALSQLAFSPIRLDPGATLRLEDVTIVLEAADFRSLLQSLCQDPDAWPYDPNLVIEDRVMRIASLTSRAPAGPMDGTAGAGGHVQWVNITLMSPGSFVYPSTPCFAQSVATGAELQAAAVKALVKETAATVYLSVTADVALLPMDRSWSLPVPLCSGQQLVLLGDPARPTTLDLSGIADVWALQEYDNCISLLLVGSSSSNSNRRRRPVALLYDLLLVNVPYPTRPNGPMSLLSASLPSFGIVRGAVGEGYPQIQLCRCTVVVPRQELIFLAGAADRNGSSDDVWPGEPPGAFNITLLKMEEARRQGPSSDGGSSSSFSSEPQRLAVQQLRLGSEVLLSNCTLMSIGSYQQLPGAVPMVPQAVRQLWAPELLAARDPQTVAQWGPGGLAVVSGLQQALTALSTCDSRPGYNPVRLIWGSDDRSVPPLGPSPADGNGDGDGDGNGNGDGGGTSATLTLSSGGPLSAAATCTVDGAPTTTTSTTSTSGSGTTSSGGGSSSSSSSSSSGSSGSSTGLLPPGGGAAYAGRGRVFSDLRVGGRGGGWLLGRIGLCSRS
ncbi:hypothetical protein PLESTF_001660100 [Pleodorina starrii]|nr:hypothetical protein PLESTF_001660100 [Pleodorina starrii]